MANWYVVHSILVYIIQATLYIAYCMANSYIVYTSLYGFVCSKSNPIDVFWMVSWHFFLSWHLRIATFWSWLLCRSFRRCHWDLPAPCHLCVAVCCSVLQCVEVCASVLRRHVVSCSVLQCVAVCFRSFRRCHRDLPANYHRCVAVCCSVLQCGALCCGVL